MRKDIFDRITGHLASGGEVILQTFAKAYRITSEAYLSGIESGCDVIRNAASDNELMVRSGRKYARIMLSSCRILLSRQGGGDR